MIHDLEEKIELPRPFVGLLDREDIDSDENEEKPDPAASIINPNVNDDRRLFQEHRVYGKDWDCNIPLDQQPNLLELYGPEPLKWPDHWYQVEGGISLIYWEKDRQTPSISSIMFVNEEKGSFVCRVFGHQGKKRKTFYDTGKEIIAKEKQVWRLVHRLEFERKTNVNEIKEGQVIRLFTENSPLEFCGFVKKVDRKNLLIHLMTGLFRNKDRNFDKSEVISCTEILSCPLFYELRKKVSCEEGTDKLK